MPEMITRTIPTGRGPMSVVTQPMPPLAMPRPAPQPPPGWRTAAPDFVGVGAARCGTTWWWQQLTRHPDGPTAEAHKELHFFDHYMRVQQVDPAAYHRYFPRPPGRLAGEWTPRYMYDYWTPPMLRRAAPEAKLLVMLRDPVHRLLSNLALTASRGIPTSHSLLHQQYERGLYGQQLSALLRQFPPAQVLVLQYEKCVADPAAQMHRTLRFLGLDPGRWQPAGAAGKVNQSAVAKPQLDADTRAALAAAYQSDLAALFNLVPDLDADLWPTAERRGGPR